MQVRPTGERIFAIRPRSSTSFLSNACQVIAVSYANSNWPLVWIACIARRQVRE